MLDVLDRGFCTSLSDLNLRLFPTFLRQNKLAYAFREMGMMLSWKNPEWTASMTLSLTNYRLYRMTCCLDTYVICFRINVVPRPLNQGSRLILLRIPLKFKQGGHQESMEGFIASPVASSWCGRTLPGTGWGRGLSRYPAVALAVNTNGISPGRISGIKRLLLAWQGGLLCS